MKPLVPGDDLPEFVSELLPNETLRGELSELLATLSSLEPAEADSAGLARGRARLLAAVAEGSEHRCGYLEASRFAPLFHKLTQFFDLDLAALGAVFARAEKDSEWQAGPLPWVALFHLDGGPAVAGLDTGLVRLKKGMPFPRHRHVGAERVLVLEGGYLDDDQRWYGPGDFHLMAEGTEHSLQMGAEQDVLLAVILAADIEVLGT
jgi:quercetin dioxygenase-like cupin family protein